MSITYQGSFAPNGSAVPESFWSSEVVRKDGQILRVNDVCPRDPSGGAEDYFLRVIPYGADRAEIDSVIEDCDLLTYLCDPKGVNLAEPLTSVLTMFKQRGFHAEAGYRSLQGKAMQVALWGPIPVDRLFHDAQTGSYRINIYRLSLANLGITLDREKRLKRELHRWKAIFNKHTFPDGMSMNYDPIDFTTVSELGGLARALISRSPDATPPIPRVNCVQWTCQAISLALNYPLTEDSVKQLGVQAEYEKYWGSLGYADADLKGIDCLPVRAYTPARAVQMGLDMYAGGVSLWDIVARLPKETLLTALSGALQLQQAPIPPAALADYYQQLTASRDLDAPCMIPGHSIPYEVVMPSTFILEARAHAQAVPVGRPTIQYVGTALPAGQVVNQA